MGVEFTWRVDGLDEELGRSTVTAGQRVSNNPYNYKPLLVNTEVRSCKYPTPVTHFGNVQAHAGT